MAISTNSALRHATSMLVKAGVPEVNAEKTSRAIVTSDVWGNPSHGLMRLPFYLQRITMGGVNAEAELKTISQSQALMEIMDSVIGNYGMPPI
jgi:(2R)-3-sulfolactate dehydrogenase (NADP+)